MQISKNSKEQISTQKALIFLIPLAIIVTIVILFIFVIPSSYSEIISRIQSYQTNQQTEEILNKKLTVLQSTSPDILNKASHSVIVLPDKNPVLALIAQIKEIAITENVAITEVKSDAVSELDGGIHKAEFKIGLEAESFLHISKVLEELAKRAPASTVDLATALPGVEEPLDPFSSEELTLLDQISKLTPPQFETLKPVSESLRENPFN
jgi:hypothetical protein